MASIRLATGVVAVLAVCGTASSAGFATTAASPAPRLTTIDAGGGGATAIRRIAGVTVPAAALEPAWSPDSSEIAFTELDATNHVDLYVAAIDGSGSREIAPDARLPSWSPDGRQIAFVRPVDSSLGPLFQYVIAATDGSDPRVVATSPVEGRPSWSANGRWLAFDGFESSMVARTDGTGSWTIPRSGGDTIFSPTTLRITFSAVTGPNRIDIFTSSPVGSRRARLTRSERGNAPLEWSRDGHRLLFESGRTRVLAIWVMDADGAHQRILTAGRDASFSPAGSRVAIANDRGLVVVATTARPSRRIVPGVVSDPTWSADGRWIAFTVRGPVGTPPQAQVEQVEVVHPDGTGLHVIAP